MNSGGLRTPVFTNYNVLVNHREPADDALQQATVSYRYVNNTSKEVRIKGRMGVNAILKPPTRVRAQEYIDIYVNWVMSEDAFKETYIDFLDRHTVPDELTGKIIDAFYASKNSAPFNGMLFSLQLQFEIALSDLVEAGGSVYLEELDLTVCLGADKSKFVEHPFSKNNRLKTGLAAELPQLGDETFVMSIRAIDNSPLKNRHDRFMLVGNQVYHIPIERDMNMDDGVYVTRRRTAEVKNMGHRGRSVELEHLSFEEADQKYCLFETIEQAKAGISQAEMRKEELNQKLYEQKLDEQQRAREKADHDHRMWRERAEADARANREKDERQRRRSDEEDVKENTRNVGDWIKIVGGIISSAFALAATLVKLKPA